MGGGKQGAEDAGAGPGGGNPAGLTKTGIGGVHMAFADNARTDEADAVELLVAEWEKSRVLGQGTKEVRDLIRQFNEA